ncbi:hypothetical protein H4R18_005317 [Coemansia javaensis]|uniref:Arrestin-like N-terminal domain-containing protein n=1 Tax=Coemansia javaensis TaxID=2761396 RepID=A0A9W8H855_9FUNG|nr:hypothetical protein H4R18_005317 [Coemansia javaensis]
MGGAERSWPDFLKRMSATIGDGIAAGPSPGSADQPPPLPPRPGQHQHQRLYQPHQHWAGGAASTVSLAEGLQDVIVGGLGPRSSDDTRRPVPGDAEPRRASHDGTRGHAGDRAAEDERPPTTERVAEFRLDIPDGVRNMTQHPGDTVVGSVVLTVTRPTRAQRIVLAFVGQQRVYVRDMANPGALALAEAVDHTLFERRLALWGRAVGEPGNYYETLPAGTLRIPFSIRIPRVNYPASIHRDRVCRVRYRVWAVFERPGTFRDHVHETHKEELCFEPLAYPPRPRAPLPVAETMQASPESTFRHIAVHVTGALVSLPAAAGERLAYQIEARTVRGSGVPPDTQLPTDPTHFAVRHVRLVVVERLTARGLIRGQEQTQRYHRDMHTITLVPEGAKPGKTANEAAAFLTAGRLRLPLDMCPFDSRLLARSYELRIECDVVDTQSFINRVTRQKSTHAAWVPLDVCTDPPGHDAFSDAVAAIVPPAHFDAAAEPEIAVGGWELERSFAKWDRSNPAWIEMARRKNEPWRP